MDDVAWWKYGVVYQIYPRSYQDSNGDGIGDLAGIRRRLDYLAWLGVDAVWISPIYPSPMADFGYDVADYCGVDPIFGTLDDMRGLIADAHARGLKVILDFVPNHSSDRHAWFQEARSSRDNPKRDWYIWKDPLPGGGPPNNWISNFGGSAWEFDEASGQYYYHAFLKEQPDLNWRNPEVRRAMYDALRFWLEMGVDGFRVDVIWHLIKDAEFRDNPPNPGWHPGLPDIDRLLQVHSADQEEVHEVIREMRAVLEEFPDRVLIGEIYLPIERLVTYYGRDMSGAHLPFNFQLIHAAWNARTLGSLVAEYEEALPEGGWPNWVLGNHDKPRIAARIGQEQARVAAMLLLTLRGTPTMYYGDEVGIGHVEIPPDRVQDPWEKNEPGMGFNRDPQRTPMHWDSGPNAGFSEGMPWLPLSPIADQCTVEQLSADEGTILSLYRKLIQLRKERRALNIGSYKTLRAEGDVFAYERRLGDERLLVYLNLGHSEVDVPLPEDAGHPNLILSTRTDRMERLEAGHVTLRPDEGVIVQV